MVWQSYRPDVKLSETANNFPDFAQRHGLDTGGSLSSEWRADRPIWKLLQALLQSSKGFA